MSGVSCSNGYVPSGGGVNQAYAYGGVTADGRPYYQGTTVTQHHIFYDSNCGGSSDGVG